MSMAEIRCIFHKSVFTQHHIEYICIETFDEHLLGLVYV